ncbi:NADP-dependent phosphogluconate dehydrogenase [Gymnodinialimonas ceratoperidinii]|uniref:6-phosphogluconate dehydrogenase, decarboxylating n=1 Tax=Gymnodinialimonas ceratoperidinii TaxID=2856823 RepID=A0A8F6YC50_9RHOB|nr:NADP-dependent phosphogluconate dehydrogenase [Gymnodinialimonas ceratoperidinii]QXT40851.1 NADP-dependent phosphogluconate dehydrogenase [Gymnodinialimonas ceratoperidinii]
MAKADIGLIGLGTMGSALALNIAEKGFKVAVWNRTTATTHEFAREAGALAANIVATETLEDLVAAIDGPRAIILMVPAGAPVDQQIAALDPHLDPDDMVIDAGNANFRDTIRRMTELSRPFLGIGVSGGEDGARHGPAIMGGGDPAHWARVEPILIAIAAKFEGSPCANLMGENGAGHFVKAVHNGIEYADMQLIAEVYGIMRDGLSMAAPEIGKRFLQWDEGRLSSYLIETSAAVACAHDEATDGPLLDVIVDAAGQKGTGRWTAIEAQHLGTPIPVIEAAVAARNMSAQRPLRADLAERFGGVDTLDISVETLEAALTCGKILCYAQGFDMLRAAAVAFEWSLKPEVIARNWRAGCIIRSAMLDDMAAAFEAAPETTLMAAPYFADILTETIGALRATVIAANGAGLPVPAMSAALAYFDTMRQARGTANMIQGQRDYFGLHGFVRVDSGAMDQHGPWADD